MMKRRQFAQLGVMAGGSVMLPGRFTVGDIRVKRDTLAMHFAPHLGMFEALAGTDAVRQIEFMADQGFTAFEDNTFLKRPKEIQDRIAATLERLDMRMGVFVPHEISWQKPGLASGDKALTQKFLDEIRSAVPIAKRLNATWMTVVPGLIDARADIGFQTAHVVEALKRASAILEPHGLVIVLEPLNFRDHPGMFLTGIPQAHQICKAVDSPSCKILFDIYHQQVQEGNLIPNIETAWEEIAYFQIGDNPGRNEPGTGEINYANIFRYLQEQGYDGILGMEHGNSTPGREGELAVIEVYHNII